MSQYNCKSENQKPAGNSSLLFTDTLSGLQAVCRIPAYQEDTSREYPSCVTTRPLGVRLIRPFLIR